MLFQPLFDEFLNSSPSVDHPAPKVVALINEVIAPVLADSTGSPSSTTVDQDAPSPNQFFHYDCINKIKLFSVTTMFSSLLLNPRRIKILDSSLLELKQCKKKLMNETRQLGNFEDKLALSSSSLPVNRRESILEGLLLCCEDRDTDFHKVQIGIIINQSKYALESLKKYGFDSCDPVDTPMVEKSKLDEDKEKPTEKHLNGGKRIFPVSKMNRVHGVYGIRRILDALTAFPYADMLVDKIHSVALLRDCAQNLCDNHSLPTMALDQKNSQCTAKQSSLFPYAATTFNIPDPKHAEFDESNTYVLERFYTSAGNPVKEILLKLNLPDHRSILTDSKMVGDRINKMTSTTDGETKICLVDDLTVLKITSPLTMAQFPHADADVDSLRGVVLCWLLVDCNIGLLHHVGHSNTDRIQVQELLVYKVVHVNDASESSKPSWGNTVYFDTFDASGSGPKWLFDIDSLTKSMNYEPVTAGNQTNGDADNKDADEVPGKGDDDLSERNDQERIDSSTQDVNTVGSSINTSSENINIGSSNINTASSIPNDPSMQSLEATGIFDGAYDGEDVGAEADLNKLETTMNVSSIPITRIHKDHPIEQIIEDLHSAPLTRRMSQQNLEELGLVSYIKKQRRTNYKDYQNCLFACFLSQIETKKVIQALADPSWIEATQEELLNKKDKRGIIVRNKARLLTQGYTQEERIDYDEVFAPIARIEAIRLFLAYASFMGFIVYQMDVKSAFLYGTIEDEVAWYETLSTYLLANGFRRGTIDKTLFIKKDKGDILLVQVYVDDIIFGSTKKSLCVEFEQMMHKRFQMSSMGELTFFLGLQVKQKDDGIFISQDKYVADILKKFDFATVKTASTPIETNKALLKDEEAEDVDVHLYRSMIGSLMYLIASRPDIMFVVCACARFQVTPKVSHLHAVKRIFRYLKGQPKLGLWYPRDSPFDLEAFFDSDYAGASLDRKSTTGGCQFLGKRLISWQCKKQTIVANSTTKAEYVAAANCCGQVLWIQNQMLDYGFNFMNTKIYIDNESTICIVKNPVLSHPAKTETRGITRMDIITT
ncbi:putative ribonuclease H-like domain-containing protein [Tanacetum coccineum]